MRCTVEDVLTAITELRTRQKLTGTHHETFAMRDEQAAAVTKTHDYFQSIWAEDETGVPRFLWNAKMRFGKTFASYQLARKLDAKRVLVVTFKPAVEDAWQTDLESHADFDGWHYLSRTAGAAETDEDPTASVPEGRTARLFRLLPGSARPRQGREHQAAQRVDPHHQLGPRHLRRVPLRRLAGHSQGAVRGRRRRSRQEGSQARIHG